MAVDSTFALIKPEAVSAGLVGEIIGRFERAGLRLLELRLLIPSRGLAEQHYGEEIERKYGRQVREWLLDYVIEGPVVALVLSGPDAVRTARSVAGEAACPTQCAPGSIRADLGTDTRECAMAAGRALRNLIHTSDSPDAARRETALWFGGKAPESQPRLIAQAASTDPDPAHG